MVRKREVERLMEKWRNRLWLSQWKITPATTETLEDDSPRGYEATAACDADPTYRQATITIALDVWDKRSARRQNRSMCHEMVHVMMSPTTHLFDEMLKELSPSKRAVYEKWYRDVDEVQAEHLCNVLLDVMGELK